MPVVRKYAARRHASLRLRRTDSLDRRTTLDLEGVAARAAGERRRRGRGHIDDPRQRTCSCDQVDVKRAQPGDVVILRFRQSQAHDDQLIATKAQIHGADARKAPHRAMRRRPGAPSKARPRRPRARVDSARVRSTHDPRANQRRLPSAREQQRRHDPEQRAREKGEQQCRAKHATIDANIRESPESTVERRVRSASFPHTRWRLHLRR